MFNQMALGVSPLVGEEWCDGCAQQTELQDVTGEAAMGSPLCFRLSGESTGPDEAVRLRVNFRDPGQAEFGYPARFIAAVFAIFLVMILSPRSTHAFQNENQSDVKVRANARLIRVRNSDELLRAAQNAHAGTTILLESGTYRGGLTLDNLHGRAGHPIVICAADARNPPIIKGGTSCLHLTVPAHVELRDLVLAGARTNGLNIDDGGCCDTPAHHVVLHGLTVQDIGSDSNHDGMKLSGLDDFRVERCTVQRWGGKGSGIDMVGCHRGIISDSTFREGDRQSNAVQMKGGSRDVTVSYCRFENAGGRAINVGGSTGLAYFRPKSPGYEAKDITVVDCTFVGSMAPIAFVGVDGASVNHNTIYRPTRWVMRILQENRNSDFVACRNGQFTKNIIVFRSDELAQTVNIGPGTLPTSFQFSENFWYCVDRPEESQRAVRLPTVETEGTYGTAPKFRDVRELDLSLTASSPASGFGPRRKQRP